MGRQQSIIKFKDRKTLVKEFKKYSKRNTENDWAYLICVVRVIKDIDPFKKGELCAVISGERHEQRSPENLKNGLGIENVEHIAFIDSVRYFQMANDLGVNLGEFLDSHFKTLTEKEHKGLLK